MHNSADLPGIAILIAVAVYPIIMWKITGGFYFFPRFRTMSTRYVQDVNKFHLFYGAEHMGIVTEKEAEEIIKNFNRKDHGFWFGRI